MTEDEEFEALEQEPVAWKYKVDPAFDGQKWHDRYDLTESKSLALWKDKDAQPLYTSPQPAQQEPVGKWMGDCIEWTENPYKFRKGQPIYTSPQPSKPWVGLTDDAILDMAEGCTAQYHDLLALARTIEAKLREKNK